MINLLQNSVAFEVEIAAKLLEVSVKHYLRYNKSVGIMLKNHLFSEDSRCQGLPYFITDF